MARLSTSGFETRQLTTVVATSGEAPVRAANTVTVNTAAPFTGEACASCAPSAANLVRQDFAAVTDRTYFLRIAFRFNAAPSATMNFAIFSDGANVVSVQFTTGRQMKVRNVVSAVDVLPASGSPVLSVDTWYVIEVKVRVPAAGATGVIGAKLYDSTGTQIDTWSEVTGQNVRNTGITFIQVGHIDAAETNTTFLLDDWALNDSTGAAQNDYPGFGKVAALWPAAQSAAGTGWQKPGGATTNLNTSVDNRPTTGIADSTSAANAEKQVRNASNTAVANLDLTMQSYADAGIGAGDTINVVQALIRTGASSTTATAGAVQIVSNPAEGSETAFTAYASNAVIAGTDPVGWGARSGPPNYAPSVTNGTGPVLRIGKRTGTTRVALVDQALIYVDYTPAVLAPVDGAVLDLVWDVPVEVNGAVLDLVWDVAAGAAAVNGAVLDLIWDTQAAVDGAVLDLKWDLAAQVNGSVLDLIWDLRAAVSADVLDLLWDLRAEVSGIALDLLWDAGGQVNAAPLTQVWDLRAEIAGAALALKWDLRSTVNGPTSTLLWDLRSLVNADALDLVWDLRAAVDGAEARLIWDLRAEVAAALTLLWDLRGQVDGRELDLVWDLEAQGAVNGVPLDLAWDLRAAVDGPVSSFLWDVRVSVDSSPATLLWDLYAVAERALALRWDLRTQVDGLALDLLWNAGVQVNGAPATLLWDIYGSADAAPLGLLWDLYAEVSRTLTLRWAAADFVPPHIVWRQQFAARRRWRQERFAALAGDPVAAANLRGNWLAVVLALDQWREGDLPLPIRPNRPELDGSETARNALMARWAPLMLALLEALQPPDLLPEEMPRPVRPSLDGDPDAYESLVRRWSPLIPDP